jgi:hypothetical protein
LGKVKFEIASQLLAVNPNWLIGGVKFQSFKVGYDL